MLKINKNSSLYFVTFFTIVTFGMIFIVKSTHSLLENKIVSAKDSKTFNLVKLTMQCTPKIGKIKNNEFYYCSGKNLIAQKLTTKKAYADVIQYLIFVNLDGLITHIDILSHKETPNLGAKIEDPSWLSTLYNKPWNLLKLKQDNGTIDSFTSASITPRILLQSASNQTKWVLENKEKINLIIK